MKRLRVTGIAAVVSVVGITPALAQRDGDPCPAGGRLTARRVEVPSTHYPTIQSAVCAVEDGGTVDIRPGTYDTTVVVWGKHVVMRGRVRRGEEHRWPILRAPAPTRDDPPAAPSGIVTVAAGGSLTLRNVRLEGGFAGIFVQDSAGPSRALDVRHASFGGGARAGILHVSQAALSVKHATFGPNLNNGIVYELPPGVFCTKEILDIQQSSFFQNTNVAVFIKGCEQISLIEAFFVASALLTIDGSGAAGIVLMNSGPLQFNGLTILNSTGFGIAAFGSTLKITNSLIAHTSPLAENGKFGDGISVAAQDFPFARQSSLELGESDILYAARAGLSNFGSFAALRNTKIGFTGFRLEGESYLGFDFSFDDQGGNLCGDEGPPGTVPCSAESTGLEPPAPIEP